MDSDPEEVALPDDTPPRRRRVPRLAILLAAALVLVVALYNSLLGRQLGNQEVLVFGQDRWIAGAQASVRVVILRHDNQQPVRDALVRVLLWPSTKSAITEMASGNSDEAGALDAGFTVPPGDGQAKLLVKVTSRFGTDFVERPIRLLPGLRVFLTTDRPAYRLGQKVRLRAWVSRLETGEPAAGEELTLSAIAPGDVPILSRRLRTDEHGTAASEVELATRAPAGTYRVRASAGAAVVEAVLPVSANPEPPFPVWLEGADLFATPGGLIRGTVRATDPLGSPMRGDAVRVWLENAAGRTVSWTSGALDTRGALVFGLPAPAKQESEHLRLCARVTDRALRSSHAQQAVLLTPQAIQVAAIPEAGVLVPGIENRLYLAARYPDGTPAAVTFRYELDGKGGSVESGPLGAASLDCIPRPEGVTLTVTAADAQGRTGSYEAVLPAPGIEPGEWALRERYRLLTGRPETGAPRPLLVRPERGLYASGETLKLDVLSPGSDAPVYVDLFAEGQTALTRVAVPRGGRATLSVRLPAALVGLVWARAYRLGSWGDVARSQRAFFVLPAGAAKGGGLNVTPAALPPGGVAQATLAPDTGGLFEMALTRAPGGSAPEGMLALPSALVPPIAPGPPSDPARSKEPAAQAAALAALAQMRPPEGWTLQQDAYALRQASVAHRRLLFRVRLRWVLLASLALLWVLAARALAPGPVRRPDRSADHDSVPSAGVEPPGEGTVAPDAPGRGPLSPFRFLIITATVAFAAMLLFSLAGPASRRHPDLAAETAAALAKLRRTGAQERPAFPPLVTASTPVPEVAFWATQPRVEGEPVHRVVAPMDSGTWLLTATSLGPDGILARETAPVTVAGDFLVSFEPPLVARPNDLLGVVVRVRNALATSETLRMKLMPGAGLSVEGDPIRTESVPGGAGITRYFRVRIGGRPGTAALTLAVAGRRETLPARREIRILPESPGARLRVTGRLHGSASLPFDVPGGAPEALLSLQPAPDAMAAAQLAELQRTPPLSALHRAAALDLARMAVRPEDGPQSAARLALERAFQELLACRDPSGAFAAFPDGKTDDASTAFAVAALEGAEAFLPGAAGVARTARAWLQAERAGSAKPASADTSVPSAFAAWCLGDRETAERLAASWEPASHSRGEKGSSAAGEGDAYRLALVCTALGPAAKGETDPSPAAGPLRERLAAMAVTEDGWSHWAADESIEGLSGSATAVETTSLALLALAPDSRYRQLVEQGVEFLAARRSSAGPLAAALALRALAASVPGGAPGSVAVVVNGKPAGDLSAAITTLDLRPYLVNGPNSVELRAGGGASPFYELSVVGAAPAPSPEAAEGAPSLSSGYVPQSAFGGRAVSFGARVAGGAGRLVCVEVPMPAGFRPVRDDLDDLVANGQSEAFVVDARRVLLLVDLGRRRQSHWVGFRMVAPAPSDVLAPAVVAFPAAYPEARATGRPMQLGVE